MKSIARLVLLLALLAFPSASARAGAPDPWARLRFLLGEWRGEGEGDPGAGTGGSTFALELDGKILVRHNRADYPATATRPAMQHRDLLVVWPGDADSLLHASYFDNEGHVIQYDVLAPGGRAVLESGGAGPRFRLTYEARPDGGLVTEFFTAPPGGGFTRYLTGTLRRVGPAAPRR
jgi:hypothetical protein